MSVRIDAATDYLIRTSDFPQADGYAISLQFYMVTDRNAAGLLTALINATGTVYEGVYLRFSGTTLALNISGTLTNGSELATGNWYHIFFQHVGTAYTVYLNGTLDISGTNAQVVTPAFFINGSNGTEFVNGRLAAMKVWSGLSTAFTTAEISAEMNRIKPFRYENIYGYYPTFPGSGERTLDYSGNGRNFTENGTLTDEDNPPVTYGSNYHSLPFVAASGNQDKTVSNAVSAGVGNNVGRSVGAITRTVNNSVSAAVGNSLSSIFRQVANNAVSDGVGYDVDRLTGGVNKSVSASSASAIGYNVNNRLIQIIGLSSAEAQGYDLSANPVTLRTVDNSVSSAVGNNLTTKFTQSISSSSATAIGNNVNRSVGGVNKSVNASAATAISYDIVTLQIQTIDDANASAVGNVVSRSTGAITRTVNKTDATALGYDVLATTGVIIGVDLSNASAVGNALGYIVGNVNKSVNKANASAIGNNPNTKYFNAVNLAQAIAQGYNAVSSFLEQTKLVNKASGVGLGYSLNRQVSAIAVLVNKSGALAIGYQVSAGTFIIVTHPENTYTLKPEYRIFEISEETRIYILRDENRTLEVIN